MCPMSSRSWPNRAFKRSNDAQSVGLEPFKRGFIILRWRQFMGLKQFGTLTSLFSSTHYSTRVFFHRMYTFVALGFLFYFKEPALPEEEPSRRPHLWGQD